MRASWAAILEAIKASDGMPVSDLSRELKMSYMGVKQHCWMPAGVHIEFVWQMLAVESNCKQ